MNDEQQKKSEEVTEISPAVYKFCAHPWFFLVILAIIFVICYFSGYIDCKTLVIALSILALADALFVGMLYLGMVFDQIGQKAKK